MAKDSLPDSLELLLDTMCNTFGGIIFLAFSITLMLFSSKQFQNTEPVEKIDEQVIPVLQQEIKNIQDETKLIEKKLDSQKKDVTGTSYNSKQKIQQIEDLDKKIRKINVDTDVLKNENKDLEDKIKKGKIQKNENKMTVQQKKLRVKELEREAKSLEKEIEKLKKKIPKTTKISFASLESTYLKPYWIFIENGKFYPLGTDGSGNQYISTRRVGNLLYLDLNKGIPINNPVSAELRDYIKSINSDIYYCQFMVKPESMRDFVALRRYLRTQKYRVNFSITEKFLLQYGGYSSNKASN